MLIGAETSGRPYVEYEIKQSHDKRNGLLGIYIHKLRTPAGADIKGANPFDHWYVTSNDGSRTYFSRPFPTYDWMDDDGYNNFRDVVVFFNSGSPTPCFGLSLSST